MTRTERSSSRTSSIISCSIRRRSRMTRTERSSRRLTCSISSCSRTSSVISSSIRSNMTSIIRRCSSVTRTMTRIKRGRSRLTSIICC